MYSKDESFFFLNCRIESPRPNSENLEKLKRKLRFNNQCFLNGHFEALLVKSLGSFFWHIRISWDHLALIDTFSDCLLGLPDGTMRTNWGNLFWETVIHCGVMEARSSCQCSLALSPILLLILFISQNIVSLFFLHVLKRCQNLQLPSALFSAEAFKDVANPEDIPKYASSETNSTNYAVNSVPSPPGSRPCGPSGSQGLVAFSWRGFGNQDSWELWPPGLQHHSHHRQQPIKTRSFPLQTQWKSLQIPSHHFNSCFILGYKTELSTKSLTLHTYFLQSGTGLARWQRATVCTWLPRASFWISDIKLFEANLSQQTRNSIDFTGCAIRSPYGCDPMTRQSGNGCQQFQHRSKSEIHTAI